MRPSARQVLTLISYAFLLSGCATGYSQFYQPYPNAEHVAERRAAPAPAKPLAERASGDISDIFARYMRQGYSPIGFSSFSSGMSESDANAVSQGSKVGADLVVVLPPRHTETRTANIPITSPTTTTSHTTGTATAYGTGGSATAHGNATTTTYGTQTTYMPFTVNRFEYGAIYFIKTRPSFGAYFKDLSDEQRQLLQTNRGASVTLVVDGSPAYVGDILVGDVILAMNDNVVNGASGLMELIDRHRGEAVTLDIIRGNERISKTIAIAP